MSSPVLQRLKHGVDDVVDRGGHSGGSPRAYHGARERLQFQRPPGHYVGVQGSLQVFKVRLDVPQRCLVDIRREIHAVGPAGSLQSRGDMRRPPRAIRAVASDSASRSLAMAVVPAIVAMKRNLDHRPVRTSSKSVPPECRWQGTPPRWPLPLGRTAIRRPRRTPLAPHRRPAAPHRGPRSPPQCRHIRASPGPVRTSPLH